MKIIAESLSREFIRETKGTNRFFAVKEVNEAFSGGELTVIMGRSGSGKTTLLNMLAGLLTPSGGRVMLDDTDIYRLNDTELSALRNTAVGYIPQGQSAVHSLSVLENVCLPFTLYKENAPDERSVHELLERLGILDLKNAAPSELSGGELRRMAIARAVIRAPGVILADEPTGDLDNENTGIVLDFLKERAQSGAAVIVVTHDMEALRFADRILNMESGVLT